MKHLGVHQGEAECSAAYTGSSLMTCTSGASLLTPYGWVYMRPPLFSPQCPLIHSYSSILFHIQKGMQRCTGLAHAMITPGLAAGLRATLSPRNIPLLITKTSSKPSRLSTIVSKEITQNLRYRRGASLVRVGPILLALGGRRRARSYNSVEVPFYRLG